MAVPLRRFHHEFRERCPRQKFTNTGIKSAEELGDDLPFLRFKRLEDVTVDGESARAVIVGQVDGQPEYRLEAMFREEDGQWKLAPAPGTRGCEAFQRR